MFLCALLDAPSKRQREEHRGLSAFPLGFRGGADAAQSRLASGSFLTRLTPAEPVHRLMANGRLCSRDNMLRHLFDKGAF